MHSAAAADHAKGMKGAVEKPIITHNVSTAILQSFVNA
jgi:hypothetical protein